MQEYRRWDRPARLVSLHGMRIVRAVQRRTLTKMAAATAAGLFRFGLAANRFSRAVRELILRGPLHAIDDQNFDWAFSRFEFQAELLLDGRKYVSAGFSRCDAVGGGGSGRRLGGEGEMS